MVSATTPRVLLVALALAGLAAVDAAVPEGSDRLAAVDAVVKADEARGRELSLTDEKMERKCAMAETEDECNDMKKKFKCKWHERSLSDPNKSACKTEPNYKKLYKECLKRWDQKDLGQGGPPDPPPDPPPGDDCESTLSSASSGCWSEVISGRSPGANIVSKGYTHSSSASSAACQAYCETFSNCLAIIYAPGLQCTPIARVYESNYMSSSYQFVSNFVEGATCEGAKPSSTYPGTEDVPEGTTYMDCNVGRRSRELSHDNPKCSKYSEDKKKCKKKWEKHGCQWAKSPPGEADRCTDYKKMYKACLEIPVREAELPEVGR